MKTFKTLYAIGFIAFLIPISSCKDDSETTECLTDMKHIAGTYSFGSMIYKGSPSSAPEDWFDACDKDNTLELTADGRGIVTDTGVKCDPESSSTFTWSVSGNQILSSDGDGTIKSFDCKTLVLSNKDVMVQGDEVIITYIRK